MEDMLSTGDDPRFEDELATEGGAEEEAPKAVQEFAEIGTHVLSIVDKNLKDIANNPVLLQRDGREMDAADKRAEAFSNERTVMYYKMKADYHRYLAEFAPEKIDSKAKGNSAGTKRGAFPASRSVEVDCALSAYKIALSLAQDKLPAAHHLTILVAHNFSTFYYTMRRSTRMACHVAKTVYENACEHVHELEGEEYGETTRVLQLLRENISKWTLDIARGDYESEAEESDVEIDEDLEDLAKDNQETLDVGNPAEEGSLLQMTHARIQQKPMGVHSTKSVQICNQQMKHSSTVAALEQNQASAKPKQFKRVPTLKRSATAPNLRSAEFTVSGKPEKPDNRMPEHHIMSLTSGFEGMTTMKLDPKGKELVPAMHELFHSYLEGKVSSPVAGNFTSKGINFSELWVEGKKTKGPQLYVHALVRMLKNFEIVPKDLEAGTIENMAAMSANATKKLRNTSVVLQYQTKYRLGADIDSKQAKSVAEEGEEKDPGRLIIPKALSFAEFVDTLGRVAIVVIRSTPGYEQKYGVESKEIINGFMRDRMHLYDADIWRKKVQRPWEAAAKEKASLRTRPGSGKQLVAKATEAAGLPINLNYLSAEFSLSAQAQERMNTKGRQRALRQIFDFYRKVKTLHKVSQMSAGRGRDALFSQIQSVSEVINLGEMLKFLMDFGVSPDLVSRRDASEIFVTCMRNSRRAAKEAAKKAVGEHNKTRPGSGKNSKSRPGSGKGTKSRPSSGKESPEAKDDDLNPEELLSSGGITGVGATWPTFLNCIERYAILADAVPQEYATDHEKVEYFITYLELDQSDRWRGKMKVFGTPGGNRSRLAKSASSSNIGAFSGRRQRPHSGKGGGLSATLGAVPRRNRLLPKLSGRGTPAAGGGLSASRQRRKKGLGATIG